MKTKLFICIALVLNPVFAWPQYSPPAGLPDNHLAVPLDSGFAFKEIHCQKERGVVLCVSKEVPGKFLIYGVPGCDSGPMACVGSFAGSFLNDPEDSHNIGTYQADGGHELYLDKDHIPPAVFEGSFPGWGIIGLLSWFVACCLTLSPCCFGGGDHEDI